MIETTVGELARHDEFQAALRGRTYTVKSLSVERSDTCLLNVYVESQDRPALVATASTPVFARRMVREVQVACHALSHGGAPVTLLHDRAVGPPPRSVFCGECAAAADEAAL